MERVEMFRQIAHIGVGILIILFIYWIGIEYVKVLLVLLFLAIVLIMDLKMKEVDLLFIDEALALIERPNTIPAYGAFWYVIGLLLIFSALTSREGIVTAIIMLALGDGVAVLAGKFGRIRLPYNRAKTLEGLLGFIIAGSTAYFSIGYLGIVIAVVCAIVESINLPIDDNFTVPLASIILLKVL